MSQRKRRRVSPLITKPKLNIKFILRKTKRIKSKAHSKLEDKLEYKLMMNTQLFKYTVNRLKLKSEKAKTLSSKIKTFPLMKQMISNLLFLRVKKKRAKNINQT